MFNLISLQEVCPSKITKIIYCLIVTFNLITHLFSPMVYVPDSFLVSIYLDLYGPIFHCPYIPISLGYPMSLFLYVPMSFYRYVPVTLYSYITILLCLCLPLHLKTWNMHKTLIYFYTIPVSLHFDFQTYFSSTKSFKHECRPFLWYYFQT